jgi:hypothetical protein
MVSLTNRTARHTLLAGCAVALLTLLPPHDARAAQLFSEDFEDAGPYSVASGLSVGGIGRAADCRGMSTGSSAASGNAVCGRRTDGTVTIELPRLASSASESGFELTVAIAGSARSFETRDFLQISLNGQVIDTLAGPSSTNRQRLISPLHGGLVSRGVFTDFTYTLPAAALTQPSRLEFRIRTSANGERIGVDAVRISGPQGLGDATAPEIVVPGDQVAEATSAEGAAVRFNVTATDDADGALTPACDPASGSTFPLGTTTVRCSASDGSGNEASAEFSVTVQDTTAPAFGPAPEGLAFEATGPAGAVAEFAVTATDAVDAGVGIECSPASGSTFPKGSSTVGCVAADASGNSASLSFEVAVLDTTAPELVLPADLRTEASSTSGATVSFDAAASDIADAAPAVTCTPASGSQFPLGDTTVTCDASDADGNSTSGTFLVSVIDSAPPTVEVPENLTAEATSASGAAVSFTASASDGADLAPELSCLPASGSTFPMGESTVQCTATDSTGNTASAGFLVTVVDTEAPSLSLPGDVSVEAYSDDGARVSFKAAASDTAGSASVDCSPASGSLFAVGSTTVDCEAKDEAGNTASGSFTVAVAAPPPPEVMAGGTSTDLTWNVPTTRDDGSPLDASELTGYQIEVAPTDGGPKEIVEIGSGATTRYTIAGLAPGEYQITVRARDADGLLGRPSRTVLYTARDLVAPQLAMPGPISVEATGSAGASVDFSVTASDGIDGQVDVTCAPQSGSTFGLGQTTVNCEASDTAGNVGTGSFTVAVVDTTSPQLQLPGTLSAEASTASGATVDFTASATDTVDGSATVNCLPASGSTFPVGDTTVNCTARDSQGNEATGSFEVAVAAPPTPEPDPVGDTGDGTDDPAGGTSGSAVLSWSVPTTRADGSPLTTGELAGYQVTISSSAGSTEVDIDDPLQTSYTASGLEPDTYEFVIRARDVSGLLSNASTPVTKTIAADGSTTTGGGAVADVTPPTLSLPGTLSVSAESRRGTTVDFSASAQDDVDGSVAVNCTPSSGSAFALGETTVNCEAADSSGNVATGSFLVAVAGTGDGGTGGELTVDGSGSAVLSWSAPSTREDGSPLPADELAGYTITMSSASGTVEIDIDDPRQTSYTVTGLAPGVYQFSIRARDRNGLLSIASSPVTKSIDDDGTGSTQVAQTDGSGTTGGTGSSTGDGTTGTDGTTSGGTGGGDDGSTTTAGTGSTAGTAVLTWSIPTTRANGDPLSPAELAGYEIYVTGETTGVSEVLQIANPMATSYTVQNLAPDTYYFAIAAYDANGLASELSAIVTKVIP